MRRGRQIHLLKTRFPYLVSALSEGDAREMAKERGIPVIQCIYIPENSPFRWEKISGRHDFPRDHLIGRFSDEELEYLTT